MQDPRYSGWSFDAIRNPSAAELSNYPQLNSDSVLLDHLPIDPSSFYIGSTLELYNTNTGLYQGTSKVLDRLGDSLTVLDTDLDPASTGGLSRPTNGFFRVHLTNFQVWVEVLSENMTAPVILKLTATKDVDGTVLFEADPRDILARYFKDIKQAISPGLPTDTVPFIAGDGYITQNYSITAYEAYDVVDSSGVSTFTVFTGGSDIGSGSTIKETNYIAVNAVHPYHETRRDGTLRLGWNDTLGSYLVKTNGLSLARMLTHASTTSQFVTSGDDHFLAFLFNGSRPSDMKVMVSYYSQPDGVGFISTERIRGTVAGYSAIMPVGPANLNPPGNAKSYKVALANQNENFIGETFTYNIRPCEGANIRFHYLNKLGGVDSFTFQGDCERSLTVKRDIISKAHMETRPGYFVSDWQRRVWRTQTDRRYGITSGYLLPEQIRSITETLFESANVWTNIHGELWTDVLIFTGNTPADSSIGRRERMVLEYGLGVDNVTQRT